MKWLKLTGTFLIVGAIIFLSVSCSKGTADANTKAQTATVQKGSISIQVTGTGNLALSTSEDVAFEVAGTVSQILVSTSESVKKGQELARLDTSIWDDQVKALQKAVDTAQHGVTTAANNVVKAQRQVATNQMAIKQTELAVQTAQNNLNLITDVKTAQDKIDKLTADIAFAKQMLAAATGDTTSGIDPSYWRTLIYGSTNLLTGRNDNSGLEAQLKQAQADQKAILDGTSLTVSTNVALQVSQMQYQLQAAQKNLNDAKSAVEDATTAVADAQSNKDQAEQAVKDAQSDLDEAKSLSPIIKSPIDGFVTKINVKGGDEVKKGTIAMQVADPNQFEANILVGEKDIFSVKVGGDATVSLDSLSGLSFPAKITAIAPLATVQQGVVNYQVTVELTSTRPVIPQGLSGAISGMRPNQSGTASGQQSGTFFQGNPGAFPAATGAQPTVTGAPPAPSSTNDPSATTTKPPVTLPAGAGAALQNMQLKSGLSATVNITITQRNDILLVPSRSISRQGRNTVVQLVKGETTEAVTIQTGISDSLNTEVMSGLNEGDKIALPTASSSTSTPRTGQGIPGPGGGIMIR